MAEKKKSVVETLREGINFLAKRIDNLAGNVVAAIEESKYQKRVLKYEIYKKNGAFQFRLLPAYSRGSTKPNGCVFVECSRAIGDRKYEFQTKKITFAMSEKDIGLFITGVKGLKQSGESFSIVHDPNAQTDRRGTMIKTMRLTRGNPSRLHGFESMPTYFLTMSQKTADETYEVKIPLEPHEIKVIVELLTKSLTKILNWE